MEGAPIVSHGRDIESDILVTLEEVLQGSIRTITLQYTDPFTGQSAMQTLRVKIPPGTRESQMIRFTGKREAGIAPPRPNRLNGFLLKSLFPGFAESILLMGGTEPDNKPQHSGENEGDSDNCSGDVRQE
jgi:hypothetical protein